MGTLSGDWRETARVPTAQAARVAEADFTELVTGESDAAANTLPLPVRASLARHRPTAVAERLREARMADRNRRTEAGMADIIPFLWFEGTAEEAATFYTSVLGGRITEIVPYGEAGPGTPGAVMTAAFELCGRPLVGLNGGPMFQHTPALSLFVRCEGAADVDALWTRLIEGGHPLMPLDAYPFSPRYGWLVDRYGVSWQLICADGARSLSPAFLFVGARCGQVREAIDFWVSLFDGVVHEVALREEGEPGPVGSVKYARFSLRGRDFVAMESDGPHDFDFTPALSFLIPCADQAEVDFYWDRLLEGGRPAVCGWLQDRFGVSWQVCPEALPPLLHDPDKARAARVMEAMRKMVKLDLATLLNA